MNFSIKAAVTAATLLFAATFGLIYWVETLEWVAFPTQILLGASLILILGVTRSVPLFKVWGGAMFGLSAWSGMFLAVIAGHVAFDMADPVDEYMNEPNLVAQYVEGIAPSVNGVQLGMTLDEVNSLLGESAFQEKRVFIKSSPPEFESHPVAPEMTIFEGYKCVYFSRSKAQNKTQVLYDSKYEVVCIQGDNLQQKGKLILQTGDPSERIGQLFNPNSTKSPKKYERKVQFPKPGVDIEIEAGTNVDHIILADPNLDPWLREWEPFVTCDGLQLGETRASIEEKKKDHPKAQLTDSEKERHRFALEHCLYWTDLAVLLSDNEATCIRGQELEVAGKAIVSVGDIFDASLPHFTPYDVKKRDRVIETTMGILAFPIEHKFEGLGKAVLIKTDKDERVVEINLSESREKLNWNTEQLGDYIMKLDISSSLFNNF